MDIEDNSSKPIILSIDHAPISSASSPYVSFFGLGGVKESRAGPEREGNQDSPPFIVVPCMPPSENQGEGTRGSGPIDDRRDAIQSVHRPIISTHIIHHQERGLTQALQSLDKERCSVYEE